MAETPNLVGPTSAGDAQSLPPTSFHVPADTEIVDTAAAQSAQRPEPVQSAPSPPAPVDQHAAPDLRAVIGGLLTPDTGSKTLAAGPGDTRQTPPSIQASVSADDGYLAILSSPAAHMVEAGLAIVGVVIMMAYAIGAVRATRRNRRDRERSAKTQLLIVRAADRMERVRHP